MTKCKKCGKEISKYIQQCPNCGAPIIFDAAHSPAQSSQPKGKPIIATICSIVAIVVGAFIITSSISAWHTVIYGGRAGMGIILFRQAMAIGWLGPMAIGAIIGGFLIVGGTFYLIFVSIRRRKPK